MSSRLIGRAARRLRQHGCHVEHATRLKNGPTDLGRVSQPALSVQSSTVRGRRTGKDLKMPTQAWVRLMSGLWLSAVCWSPGSRRMSLTAEVNGGVESPGG